jgi:predicted nucleic acid-binding protein
MKANGEVQFPASEAGQVAAFLRRAALIVVPTDIPLDVCRDPTDIPVLGTAVAGDCGLLISIDHDSLDMQHINEIPVIRPREYWRRTTEGG